MTRIVSDANGDYDLAAVIAVTKVPRQVQSAGTVTQLPPTAKLWFEGTGGIQTLLDHAETRTAWLALRQAEEQPLPTLPLGS